MSASATAILALGIFLGSGLQRINDTAWAVLWPAPRPACVGQQELDAELKGLKESLFASHFATGLAVGITVSAFVLTVWLCEWLLVRAPRAATSSFAVSGATSTPSPQFALAAPVPSAPQLYNIGDEDEFDAQLLLAYRPIR